MDILSSFEKEQVKEGLPDFRAGDSVRVHFVVREGEKERVQGFEGLVIRKTRRMNRATFTVRKLSYGVGVERTFPLNSPLIKKIDVVTRGQVRRARLYYLRGKKGKAARGKERRLVT